jgi:hypothetical protein
VGTSKGLTNVNILIAFTASLLRILYRTPSLLTNACRPWPATLCWITHHAAPSYASSFVSVAAPPLTEAETKTLPFGMSAFAVAAIFVAVGVG